MSLEYLSTARRLLRSGTNLHGAKSKAIRFVSARGVFFTVEKLLRSGQAEGEGAVVATCKYAAPTPI